MRVLGICHDVFTCSAALVDENGVRHAIPEERLDRVKQSRVFPVRAIDECLGRSGIALDDVEVTDD